MLKGNTTEAAAEFLLPNFHDLSAYYPEAEHAALEIYFRDDFETSSCN